MIPVFPDHQPHRFAFLLAQDLGQKLAVRGIPGQQNFVRQGPPFSVILLEEIAQKVPPGRKV